MKLRAHPPHGRASRTHPREPPRTVAADVPSRIPAPMDARRGRPSRTCAPALRDAPKRQRARHRETSAHRDAARRKRERHRTRRNAQQRRRGKAGAGRSAGAVQRPAARGGRGSATRTDGEAKNYASRGASRRRERRAVMRCASLRTYHAHSRYIPASCVAGAVKNRYHHF